MRAGVSLAGTLTVPQGQVPAAVVVLIAGYGPWDRDLSMMGHKRFFVLADYLAHSGIATLRFDKRGVGLSTGNYATATSADFADDVRAGIDYLKTRTDIGVCPIGLLGCSEGGMIACMVAAASTDLAFVVTHIGQLVKKNG